MKVSHIKEVILVRPRGFCAGVARAVKAVEDALEIFGAPVYVKHEIVHNKTVVADLERRGAVTVETVSDVPDGAVVVFSAHGSPPDHYEAAKRKGCTVIDATCPLVTKVHLELHRFGREGYSVVYIGHRGHIEGEGVRAEARVYGKEVPIVETAEDVDALTLSGEKLAYLTQTTLSVDETGRAIAALKKKFPTIVSPPLSDICYATTNRQAAVKTLAKEADIIFIIGSQNSSNSNRLAEVARAEGKNAYLIDSAADVREEWLRGARTVGVSAGASAPEYRVEEVKNFFIRRGATAREVEAVKENMSFSEPLELAKLKTKEKK